MLEAAAFVELDGPLVGFPYAKEEILGAALACAVDRPGQEDTADADALTRLVDIDAMEFECGLGPHIDRQLARANLAVGDQAASGEGKANFHLGIGNVRSHPVNGV